MFDGKHVNIGSIGSGNGNNISFTQNHAAERDRIKFEVDPESVQRLSRESVKKGAWAYAGSFPALGLSGMSILADLLGIYSYFNLGWKIAAYTIFVIAMVGLVFFKTKGQIGWRTIPEGQAHFEDGRWVERDESGDYFLYRKTAPCNYQGCGGTVRMQTPPPRERHNHDYIGVCNIGNKQHTYRVDFNGIGERQHFNWDPIDPPKQS